MEKIKCHRLTMLLCVGLILLTHTSHADEQGGTVLAKLLSELVSRGVPDHVDFSQEIDIHAWNKYLTDFESRGEQNKLDEQDFRLFSEILSLNFQVHPTFIEVFAASAFYFKGGKFQAPIADVCKKIMSDDTTTDWAKVWAADALTQFGDRPSVDTLLKLYMGQNPYIKNVAARSLKRLGYSFPDLPKNQQK